MIKIETLNQNPLNTHVILGSGCVDVSSIPSPYARMHVFNAAFENVTKLANANGVANLQVFNSCRNEIFDKLISDCLDAFEMFFYYDRLNLAQQGITVEYFEIENIREKKNSDASITEKHIGFWNILDTYGKTYRDLRQLPANSFIKGYFIKKNNQVFAATSPLSGFYTRIGAGFSFLGYEGKRLFSDVQADWRGIGLRNQEFQEFMYHVVQYELLPIQYEQLHNYIIAFAEMSGGRATWDANTQFNIAEFGFGDTELVFGCIQPNKQQAPALRPSIIPNKYHATYFRHLLLPQEVIQFELLPSDYKEQIEQRIFKGGTFPWFSVEDFFREYIIEVKKGPDAVNPNRLSVKNNQGGVLENIEILYPVKDLFFEYFDEQILRDNTTVIKFNEGNYLVKIKMPTARGSITLQKEYKQNTSAKDFPIGMLIPINESERYLSIYPFLQEVTNWKETGTFKLDRVTCKPDKEMAECPYIVPNVFNEPLFRELTRRDGQPELALSIKRTDYKEVLNERELLGQEGQKWLSVDDFLYDYLIELNDPVNTERFYSCEVFNEYGEKTDNYFLMPIKEKYFKYFDFTKIAQKDRMRIDTKIDKNTNSIRYIVSLEVPVESGSIRLQREYYKKDGYNPEYPAGKVVSLQENSFYMGVYPFVKDISANKEMSNAFYRSMLYYPHKEGLSYELNFKKQDSSNGFVNINPDHVYSQSFDRQNAAFPVAHYYALERVIFDEVTDPYNRVRSIQSVDFDAIQVVLSMNGIRYESLLLPRFHSVICDKSDGNVGIDFGTSNTYMILGRNVTIGGNQRLEGIEYSSKIDNSDASTLVMLHKPVDGKYDFEGLETEGVLNQLHYLSEFMPTHISPQDSYKFTIPSVLNTRLGRSLSQNSRSLVDANIAIAYFQKGGRILNGTSVDQLRFSLKWLKQDDDELAIKLYLDQLMLMARCQMLALGFNLEKVKVVWTKPLAMEFSYKLSDAYKKIWPNLFNKYFRKINTVGVLPGVNSDGNEMVSYELGTNIMNFLYETSESKTPVYALDTAAVFNTTASIDIGGGSTDILVYNANQINLTASFEFAANDLFRGPRNVRDNVFYKKYPNNPSTDGGAAQSVEKNPNMPVPELFNYKFATAPALINQLFTKSNPEWMFLLSLHCSAILYHTAQTCLLAMQDITQTINLRFSGNGSNLMKLLDSGAGVGFLSRLASAIFRRVFDNENINVGISYIGGVEGVSMKAATALGAMKWMNGTNIIRTDDQDRFCIPLGDARVLVPKNKYDNEGQEDTNWFFDNERARFDVPRNTRLDNWSHLEAVKKNVECFIEYFYDNIFGLGFGTVVGAPNISRFSKDATIRRVTQTFIKDSLCDYLMDDDHKPFTQSLFFVPIKRLIVDLSKILATQ